MVLCAIGELIARENGNGSLTRHRRKIPPRVVHFQNKRIKKALYIKLSHSKTHRSMLLEFKRGVTFVKNRLMIFLLLLDLFFFCICFLKHLLVIHINIIPYLALAGHFS